MNLVDLTVVVKILFGLPQVTYVKAKLLIHTDENQSPYTAEHKKEEVKNNRIDIIILKSSLMFTFK